MINDRKINNAIFQFQFIFVVISFLNTKFLVYTFWKDESKFDFGFIDTKRNVFDITKNSTNKLETKLL